MFQDFPEIILGIMVPAFGAYEHFQKSGNHEHDNVSCCSKTNPESYELKMMQRRFAALLGPFVFKKS